MSHIQYAFLKKGFYKLDNFLMIVLEQKSSPCYKICIRVWVVWAFKKCANYIEMNGAKFEFRKII
ncbi:hypothetical protein BpHYR1_010344 [Brachionus plicatilis]|uniref:Uncharacterized protein n=1 Tax=Brachionus plicatilis TaxID=10195 RepID=A0A3M7R1F5_BRAPC|nr:hypothetical protein BpHYR1_010344 [Brachionus plicatilis]